MPGVSGPLADVRARKPSGTSDPAGWPISSPGR